MKSIYLIAQFLIITIGLLCGQTVDNSFHKPVPYRPAKITAIKVLPDSKILLGGDITFYNEENVKDLIRLNADGSLDEEFNFNGKDNLLVERIELLSTGDIVILAQEYESMIDFYSYKFSLFLLDSNGNIKKETRILPYAISMVIQDDDKILVCGSKSPTGFLFRYNADLTIDNSFNNDILFNDEVYDVVFKNGKIFASGYFTQVKGTDANKIVKLDLNGSIDSTFNTATGTTNWIPSITIQDDGKIIFGNSWSYNGITNGGMTRLNPDGSTDLSFHSPEMSGPYSKIVVKDSSIYFSSYKRVDGIDGSYLFRVKLNGEMDTGFKPILLDDFGYTDFHIEFLQENILYNNSSLSGNIYGLSLCNQVGDLINEFKPEVSRYGTINLGDYLNGKLVVSGDFISIDGNETYGIAMVNDDGTIDRSFSLNENLGKPIQIEVLPDTCLLFSTGKAFVKLNKNGQVMPDFHFSPFKFLFEVSKFGVLDNGKIFASNGYNVYRLNSDGTEDVIDIGTGMGGSQSSAFDFDVQNNKVVFGSMYDSYNGTPVNMLFRLNYDGSLDQTFDIGSGPNARVSMVKVLSSGEMIIGGTFDYFNGIQVPNGLVKLGINGSFDHSFNENQKLSSFNGTLWHNPKVEQSDSMLYIRGLNVFGVAQVVAVNINGKIDNEFAMPMIVSKINDIIVLHSDSQNLKRTKSTISEENNSYMFALGNFEYEGTSFLMKLGIGENIVSAREDISTGDNVYLYPMPVDDKLCISFAEHDTRANLNLFALNGQQLYSLDLNSSYGEIDMRGFAAGVYVLKITTATGKLLTYKIAKK